MNVGFLDKVRKHLPRNWKDIVGSVVVALLVIIYETDILKLRFGKLTNPGPAFLPVVAGVFVLVLCIVGIVKALVSKDAETDSADLWEEDSGVPNTAEDKASAVGPLCVMAALLVYYAIVGKLGFFSSTFLLVYFLLRLLNYKNWWKSLIAAVLIMAVSYVVFTIALEIRFPGGLLF